MRLNICTNIACRSSHVHTLPAGEKTGHAVQSDATACAAAEAPAAEGAPADAEEAAPSPPPLPISQLDIRIARIVDVSKHPDADSCAHTAIVTHNPTELLGISCASQRLREWPETRLTCPHFAKCVGCILDHSTLPLKQRNPTRHLHQIKAIVASGSIQQR